MCFNDHCCSAKLQTRKKLRRQLCDLSGKRPSFSNICGVRTSWSYWSCCCGAVHVGISLCISTVEHGAVHVVLSLRISTVEHGAVHVGISLCTSTVYLCTAAGQCMLA